MLKSVWVALSPSIKMSSMKQALAPSLKLCQIIRHMSTRIFSYFLP